MENRSYQLEMPAFRGTGVVFASPHSGRDYPWAFLRNSVLGEHEIRSSEDAFVDLVFGGAVACGAPLLSARAPRAYVDLNRSPDEYDPALIRNVPKSALSLNPRVASGLGVIPRVVSNGRVIRRGKILRTEADLRVLRYWKPYHKTLERLLSESREMFGNAILVDCHSMPRAAIADRGTARPDIVLGDRYGASASGGIVDRIEAAFVNAGFSVVRNEPFAGAYIAQHYGRPHQNRHVIQVEIDRSLYMDEAAITLLPGFDDFKARISAAIADIVDIGVATRDLAAE
jgi:N-formylglutamate deformylase